MPLCGLIRKSILCIWPCINLEFVRVWDTLWTKLLNGTLMGVNKKEFSQNNKCVVVLKLQNSIVEYKKYQ